MRTRTVVLALLLSLLLSGCLPSSVRRYLAADHMSQGYEAEKQGRYDEALKQFRLALEFVPTGVEGANAHLAIGQVLARNKGDVAGAVSEFRSAVAAAPKLPAAHLNLGYALQRQGDFNGAITEYRAVVALDPQELDYHLYLGNALAAKGLHDDAVKEFQAAIELHPNSGAAHFNLAMEYNRVKDYAGAIKEYQAAIADDPSSASAWNNLAWLYATAEDQKSRDPAKALSNARKAVEMEPQAAFIHDTYAEALYVNGKYDEAVATQQETLKLLRPTDDPKDYLARMEKYKAAAKKHGGAG
jgi:tetratricopeptide (TPR) repeat protein